MRGLLAALAALLFAVPAAAQLVSVTTLLEDSDRDGKVRVVAQAVALGVPRGSVLTRCGDTFTYAYGLATCTPTLDAPSDDWSLALSKARWTHVRGAYKVITTWPGTDYAGLVSNGLVATDIKRLGIQLKGKVDGVQVLNFRLEHGPVDNDSPHLPAGIMVENGRGIVIRDGTISGFRMARPPPGKYWNGDGIIAERDVDGLSIERVTVRFNSDGGLDLKSTNTWLNDVTAEGNGINYRFWGTGRAGTITSSAPRKFHLGLYTAMREQIDHLIASSPTPEPIFFGEGLTAGSSLIVLRCTFNVPPGTPLWKGQRPTELVLGPGCVVP